MGGLKHLKEKGHKVTAHHGRDKQMAGRTLQQQSSLVAGGGGVWGCGGAGRRLPVIGGLMSE